jgi:hypothetical protein
MPLNPFVFFVSFCEIVVWGCEGLFFFCLNCYRRAQIGRARKISTEGNEGVFDLKLSSSAREGHR